MTSKKRRKRTQDTPSDPKAEETPIKVPEDIFELEASEESGPVFQRTDWLIAAAGFLVALVVFWHHMAPEVTLQDSGELVTGAFTLGVPHAPGYPLWAFLGFIWSRLVVPFGNPAWRLGLMSVFTGAMVVGVMTLLMIRSIQVLLSALPGTDRLDPSLRRWIAGTVGLSTALLFGFNRGVWLWACVSEMRVLNVFLFMLIGCVFFVWLMRPRRRGYLYATMFLFGLSMTNHQTVAIMVVPLAVGALAAAFDQFSFLRRSWASKLKPPAFRLLMKCLGLGGELLAAGVLSLSALLLALAWLRAGQEGLAAQRQFWTATGLLLAGLLLLLAGRLGGWIKIRRSLLVTALFLAGCAFYLYLPLAAATNPPMNWGYTATREGFLHHIFRGQYGELQAASVLSREFGLKIMVFIRALLGQYSLPLSLWALVSGIVLAACWGRFKPRARSWMVYVWAAFFATSLGLLLIINPKLDRQEQEITIKFFAPAHGFFAMLTGYGLALGIGGIAGRWKQLSPRLVRVACLGLLALPLITYTRNWPLCALGGYDFGYEFGARMFNPGGGYPPMEPGAVLFGGTDPGRFVPTYMIFCESRVPPKDRFRDPAFDRSDVYIITQNALADNTYMNYIRDHYSFERPSNDSPLQRWLGRDRSYPSAPIHLPGPNETNHAFQQYFNYLQATGMLAQSNVKAEGGRVSVQGVQQVMAINGLLAKWIFEQNKDRHAFYVEESYAIPWMYPHLCPSGIIMRLTKDPLPGPQENPALWQDLVARDRAYWDRLSSELLAREEFHRNRDAKNAFSKLRCAIAGIYLFRGLAGEAEYALRQALALCPDGAEGSFRLAELYAQEQRFPEARTLLENYLRNDPYNDAARQFLDRIKSTAPPTTPRVES